MTVRSEFEFLTVDDVLAIAADQVARYGGAFGVRDFGLLESAVSAPLATFGGEYLYRDLCEFAAAYLFSLAKNHPFVDGNKRTATAAALVFLRWNGFDVAPGPELTRTVLAVVESRIDKTELAAFLRSRLIPLP